MRRHHPNHNCRSDFIAGRLQERSAASATGQSDTSTGIRSDFRAGSQILKRDSVLEIHDSSQTRSEQVTVFGDQVFMPAGGSVISVDLGGRYRSFLSCRFPILNLLLDRLGHGLKREPAAAPKEDVMDEDEKTL